MKKMLGMLFCILMIFGSSTLAKEVEFTDNLKFHGETTNWSGTYNIKISDQIVDTIGTLKYKGNDVNSVGPVSVSFKTIAGESSGTSLLAGVSDYSPIGEKGTFTSRAQSSYTSLYTKVPNVKVTVKWKGESESFYLCK